MRGGRAIAVLLAVAMLLPAGCGDGEAAAEKPQLMLMTSLPLRLGEGSIKRQLQGGGGPAPAYRRLQQFYSILSLDDLDPLDTRPSGLLLLVQPRALAPSELVALDDWLRAGGHALILADPALMWPSAYPLGDARRPLFTSMLSPLFAHWGVELVLPMDRAENAVEQRIGGWAIETVTPGAFVKRDDAAPVAACEGTPSALVTCAVGQGRAVLLADADLLQARFWEPSGPLGISGDTHGNMDLVVSLLAEMGRAGEKAEKHKAG